MKRKSVLMEMVELKRGRSVQELIREQMEMGRSLQEIAQDLGISYWTLRSWLSRLGGEVGATVRFPSDKKATTP